MHKYHVTPDTFDQAVDYYLPNLCHYIINAESRGKPFYFRFTLGNRIYRPNWLDQDDMMLDLTGNLDSGLL